jgi:excisionase family DNA binding protein
MVSAAAPHGMRSNAMTGQPVSVRDHTHAASRKIAPARRLRTIKYAAEYLDVSTRTIERYIAIGKLDAYRVGDRLVRVHQRDLDALVRKIPTVRMAAGFRHDNSGQAAS